MADTEYISKEAALACFHDWIDHYGHEHTADEMVEYQRIEDLPVADVRPVVKAVWEDGNKSVRTSGHLFNWWCSRCGNPQHTPVAKTLVEFTIDNPYCHKCGADMREVKADG